MNEGAMLVEWMRWIARARTSDAEDTLPPTTPAEQGKRFSLIDYESYLLCVWYYKLIQTMKLAVMVSNDKYSYKDFFRFQVGTFFIIISRTRMKACGSPARSAGTPLAENLASSADCSWQMYW